MKYPLYIKEIKGKGRGVFAVQPIEPDTLIETCPLLVMPAENAVSLTNTALGDYFFHFNREENIMALALGFGSLYNHAKASNAIYFINREARAISFYSVRPINAHEEICINYGGEPGKDFSEWFSARNLIYQP